MRRLSLLCLGLALAIVAATATAQTGARKVAGEVVRFNAGMLQIRTAAGALVDLTLGEGARISARGASDLSHVEQGSFVGVTAAPRADGTLVASEVHIFPEALRGLSEGHHVMAAGGTMTNATVSSVTGGNRVRSTMTNATVAKLADSHGERTLTLSYKGGQEVIVVPSATPVTTYEEGTPSLLIPGAHVVVSATTQTDGTLRAERVTVGTNGYVPPL